MEDCRTNFALIHIIGCLRTGGGGQLVALAPSVIHKPGFSQAQATEMEVRIMHAIAQMGERIDRVSDRIAETDSKATRMRVTVDTHVTGAISFITDSVERTRDEIESIRRSTSAISARLDAHLGGRLSQLLQDMDKTQRAQVSLQRRMNTLIDGLCVDDGEEGESEAEEEEEESAAKGDSTH